MKSHISPEHSREVRRRGARARTETLRPHTLKRKQTFLDAFAQTGTLTGAEYLAGIYREQHRWWMRHDPDYAERFRNLKAATPRMPRRIPGYSLAYWIKCWLKYNEQRSTQAPLTEETAT